MRGATRHGRKGCDGGIFQSTHPCTGCDHSPWPTSSFASQFQSTHLCAGCDIDGCTIIINSQRFQSTHPCAGCDTICTVKDLFARLFQSTHPCAGCDLARRGQATVALRISIHAPLRGVRLPTSQDTKTRKPHFNPRTPARGATANMHNLACLNSCSFTKSAVCLLQVYMLRRAISTENAAFGRFLRCEAPGENMFASASHRVKASAAPPAHRSAWRRHVQCDSDNCSRGCKSAGCPFPGRSVPQGDA